MGGEEGPAAIQALEDESIEHTESATTDPDAFVALATKDGPAATPAPHDEIFEPVEPAATTDPNIFATLVDEEGLTVIPALHDDGVEHLAIASVQVNLLDRIVDPKGVEQLATSFLDNLPPTAAGPELANDEILDLSVALLSLEAGAEVHNRPDDAAPQDATDSSAGASPSTDKANAVAGLLRKADLAMTEQRYTLPPTNNARAYYSAVLAEEPDNPHALAGLSEISQKYWKMARRLLDTNDLSAAERITRRALRADGKNKRLLALAEEIELTRQAAIVAAQQIPPEPLLSQIEEAPPLDEPGQEELDRSAIEESHQSFFVH